MSTFYVFIRHKEIGSGQNKTSVLKSVVKSDGTLSYCELDTHKAGILLRQIEIPAEGDLHVFKGLGEGSYKECQVPAIKRLIISQKHYDISHITVANVGDLDENLDSFYQRILKYLKENYQGRTKDIDRHTIEHHLPGNLTKLPKQIRIRDITINRKTLLTFFQEAFSMPMAEIQDRAASIDFPSPVVFCDVKGRFTEELVTRALQNYSDLDEYTSLGQVRLVYKIEDLFKGITFDLMSENKSEQGNPTSDVTERDYQSPSRPSDDVTKEDGEIRNDPVVPPQPTINRKIKVVYWVLSAIFVLAVLAFFLRNTQCERTANGNMFVRPQPDSLEFAYVFEPLTGDTLGQVYYGDKVSMISRNTCTGWCKVRYGRDLNNTGKIRSTQLLSTPPVDVTHDTGIVSIGQRVQAFIGMDTSNQNGMISIEQGAIIQPVYTTPEWLAFDHNRRRYFIRRSSINTNQKESDTLDEPVQDLINQESSDITKTSENNSGPTQIQAVCVACEGSGLITTQGDTTTRIVARTCKVCNGKYQEVNCPKCGRYGLQGCKYCSGTGVVNCELCKKGKVYTRERVSNVNWHMDTCYVCKGTGVITKWTNK